MRSFFFLFSTVHHQDSERFVRWHYDEQLLNATYSKNEHNKFHK